MRIVLVGIGILLFVLGNVFVFMGDAAKTQITESLVAQDIILGKDAVQFGGEPGALVRDAKTAEVQAKIIALHTDGKYGMYAHLDRDDPHRADIIKGLTLRNSLNMAVMGYGLANLAMGTGVVAMLGGAGLGMLAFRKEKKCQL